MKVANWLTVICVLLLTCLMAACTAIPEKKERYFWPPYPDIPRIEWLASYQTELDIKEHTFLEMLLGTEDPLGVRSPLFVSADGNGKIYVSDLRLTEILVFDMVAKSVHVLAEQKMRDAFQAPTGVALDSFGNIYVADNKTRKITMFNKNEDVIKVFDLSESSQSIGSIAVDPVRMRLIAPDLHGHKFHILDIATGKLYKTIGKLGNGDGEFKFPTSASVAKDGTIVICDSQNARIQRFTPEGAFINKFGRRGDAVGDFNIIKTAAVDSYGHVYVTDGKNHVVNIYSDQGEMLLRFGGVSPFTGKIIPGGFLIPQGIYVDKNETIYVADQMNGQLHVFQYITDKYIKEHPITKDAPPAVPNTKQTGEPRPETE